MPCTARKLQNGHHAIKRTSCHDAVQNLAAKDHYLSGVGTQQTAVQKILRSLRRSAEFAADSCHHDGPVAPWCTGRGGRGCELVIGELVAGRSGRVALR